VDRFNNQEIPMSLASCTSTDKLMKTLNMLLQSNSKLKLTSSQMIYQESLLKEEYLWSIMKSRENF
jgi:hypothetical protein